MELAPNDSVLKPSASMAIGSNGYKILAMPKYASKIKTTIVDHCPNPILVKMKWLDADNKEVAWHIGEYDPKRYPLIGEVIETFADSKKD